MKKNACFATLVGTLVLASSIAFAGDLGDDEVTLKNGGSIRGTIVSVEPGTKVVLMEVGSDKPRTVPWGEVADVEKGKYKKNDAQPGAAGPGYTTPPPAADAAASGKGVVKLHIESPKPVQVIEETGNAVAAGGGYVVAVSASRVACTSPCDKTIDGSRGQAFAIGGDGVTPSDRFYLNDRQGDVSMRVEPGSSGRRVAGNIMVFYTGLPLAVAGGLLVVLAAATPDVSGSHQSSPMIPIGAATLGVGAALIIGGIVLRSGSGTSFNMTDGAKTAGVRMPRAAQAHWWRGEF